MKTRLISAILACIMIVSLTACANEGPGKTPDESTKDTTEAQTTENVTTEETTEPAAELAFNEDLLSDLGMTYPNIANKRGELIDFGMPSGGVAYIFENGFGYIWGTDDIDWDPELKNGDPYPVPPQVECSAIITSSADNLFLGLTDSLHISDIEEIYGISHIETGESGEFGNFCSVFSYEDKTIAVFTTEKEWITPNAIVTIEMK